MVKSLSQIIYHGAKIFAISLQKSIRQEIELSREAAKIRYREKIAGKASGEPKQMSLDEALRVLNVEQLNSEEIERKYKHLFEANSKEHSGSFYLQSKIYRAKQRLGSELNKDVVLRNNVADISNK